MKGSLEQKVDHIVNMEWRMFQRVHNIGGRASCQDDFSTFYMMRSSQFLAWDERSIDAYLDDLRHAETAGRNLLTEKYAYMGGQLRIKDQEKSRLVEKILAIMIPDTLRLRDRYPNIFRHGRPITTAEDLPQTVSVESYLRGEMQTYSRHTLECLLAYISVLMEEGDSLTEKIERNTVRQAGYESLEEAEEENRQ